MVRLDHADCIDAMRDMDEASVDAIVCDPPYSLGFMSKAWDMQVQHEGWTQEALRVLKPGGHLLAFGGTRTSHRLACAIEDAGFEIRDSLLWLYGSGFPKSHDVSKAIDKAAGAEREVVGIYEPPPDSSSPPEIANHSGSMLPGGKSERREGGAESRLVTAPATPEAEKWQGWGTALKPGHEPIVVARKPLIGTVAANVQEHGTGALNVDGCRVWTDPADPNHRPGQTEVTTPSESMFGNASRRRGELASGRWPANVVLSHTEDCNGECAEGCPVRALDEQGGERRSAGEYTKGARGGANDFQGPASIPIDGLTAAQYGDTGGASRFFPTFRYQAKSSRRERSAGLPGGERNIHPTCKPLSLMRWLCRLVTPPDGLILDPFVGSGTTGCAAVLEGFNFVGIEREAEYVEIARARIEHWEKQTTQLALAESA